jgi:hypothetical protein
MTFGAVTELVVAVMAALLLCSTTGPRRPVGALFERLPLPGAAEDLKNIGGCMTRCMLLAVAGVRPK